MTEPAPERELLRSRLRDHFSSHYQIIVAIFKGVTLFNGVTVLADILATDHRPGGAGWKWVALAFWLASFVSIILTYDAMLVSTIVSTELPNAIDIIMPFIFGLLEFMQFSVLQPLPGTEAGGVSSAQQLEHLTWWPLVHALLLTSASLLVGNKQGQLTRNIRTLPGDLKATITEYKHNMKQDQLRLVIVAVWFYISFLALRGGLAEVPGLGRLDVGTLREYQGVLGLGACVGMTVGIATQRRAQRQIARSLRSDGPAGLPDATLS